MFTGNDTLQELLHVVEDLPKATQKKLLKKAKLEKALVLAKEIDAAQKKVKIKVSDNEIAGMISNYRKKKNASW